MGTLMGASKTQKLMKAGRYIVVVPIGEVKEGAPKATWAWWVEKESDLIIAIGKGAEDKAMAVIDGKTPNAVEHPIRSELARTEGGFTPLGQFFIDPSGLAKALPPAGTRKDAQAGFDAGLAQSGVTRFDVRWGFQDAALMTITRLKAPPTAPGSARASGTAALRQGQAPTTPRWTRIVHRGLGRFRQGL